MTNLIEFKSRQSILTCIVTYNRLDLTKLTIQSYLATVSSPHFLVVVDNGSDEATKEYLISEPNIDLIIWNSENKYPGVACNQGWEEGLKMYPHATLLHRSDNDIFYRNNWDLYAIETFEQFKNLGLFGLLDLSDYYFYSTIPEFIEQGVDVAINRHLHDIGGSYILRRELWDQGFKHTEKPWSPGRKNQEDHILTRDVYNSGWWIGHSTVFLACHLGNFLMARQETENFAYYQKTISDRGGFVRRNQYFDETYEKLIKNIYNPPGD